MSLPVRNLSHRCWMSGVFLQGTNQNYKKLMGYVFHILLFRFESFILASTKKVWLKKNTNDNHNLVRNNHGGLGHRPRIRLNEQESAFLHPLACVR